MWVNNELQFTKYKSSILVFLQLVSEFIVKVRTCQAHTKQTLIWMEMVVYDKFI